MSTAPKAGWDSTLAILRDGYRFIPSRCQRLRSDVFVTRLMGQRAICIHGAEAAELFYDETRLQRGGAVPRRVQTTLFGRKAVHTLDDAKHRERKAAFLHVMTDTALEHWTDILEEEWRRAGVAWERNRKDIVLFDEARLLLTRAVCAWADVPLLAAQEQKRADDFTAMIDAFGGFGARLWRGKAARRRAQHWIGDVLAAVRSGRRHPRPGSALQIMAEFRESNGGQLLDTRVAAVELLNVLRPTVAIAWYVCFAALPLFQAPVHRTRITDDNDGSYLQAYFQEVRRFFPFAPFLGARVRQSFVWHGYTFPKGALVLLDVYGTNHDARWWPEPERFDPNRFIGRTVGRYELIPQGGGTVEAGHRCPGEELTRRAMFVALRTLGCNVTGELAPGQDLSFPLSRMPTRPKSGVVLQHVRSSP